MECRTEQTNLHKIDVEWRLCKFSEQAASFCLSTHQKADCLYTEQEEGERPQGCLQKSSWLCIYYSIFTNNIAKRIWKFPKFSKRDAKLSTLRAGSGFDSKCAQRQGAVHRWFNCVCERKVERGAVANSALYIALPWNNIDVSVKENLIWF